MKKVLGLALALLISTQAFAADNATIITPGVGVTIRSVDVGAGVQAPGHALVNASGTQIGVAGAEVFVGGRGTAGTAAGGVLTVQGAASMTKLLVTPDSVALPANQSVNVSQINGVTPLMGNGATGTGSHRVTIANDNTLPTGWPTPTQVQTVTTWGGGTLGAMANYGTSPGAVLVPGVNAFVTNANANGGASVANSSPVVPANQYSNYETVAASQTGQAMGATGGTGDYLSHCVIYPQTTTPGVVTVFDNTNAAGTNAIAFPGGASSVSNLAPIPVPVGAFSTAGAWKVTTGANVIVTCYGKFT